MRLPWRWKQEKLYFQIHFGVNYQGGKYSWTTHLDTIKYTDHASIATYAVSAMNWASANNIVRPVSSGTFALKSNATRTQAADALMNFDRTQQAVPAPGTTPSRATVEMNDPNARPAISGNVSNMEQYDIVFIGYPIWWGQAPRLVSTFFERYDFSGKTIVPLDRPLFDKLNPAPVGAGFFPRAGIIYMDFPGLSRKIRQISSTYRSLALIIAVGPRRSSRRMFPPPYSIWTWPWTRQRGLYLSKNGTRHSNPRWA